MRKALRVVLVLLCAIPAMAQERTVTGRATSAEDGSSLPGVNVIVKGTTNGTTTDADGRFTISVSGADEILVFSFIGLKTEEVAVGQRTTIDVALSWSITELSEVVVTTFGEAKKTSFTGSYSQINAESIAARPLSNAIAAIAGSTAGVSTTAGTGQPGAAPDIRIRGFGSYSSGNAPLYVVDGIPYTASIANLSSADIETMTILKDAASTALYGARAANGVVMITTKKGRSKDGGTINLRYTKGFSKRGLPEYERVGVSDYYPLMWEMLRNNLAYTGTTPQDLATAGANATATLGTNVRYNVYDVPFNQLVDANGVMNPNARLLYSKGDLDWEAPLMRQGTRDELNLNFSGGNDKSDFYASLSYLDDQGYQIKSDYERITARLNYNTQLKKWLKTGGNVSATITESKQSAADGGTTFVNPFFFSRNMGPIFPVYAHDPANPGTFLLRNGERFYDYGNMSALGLPNRPQYGGRHAIAETKLNQDFFRRNVFSVRGYMEVSFLKDFKFTTNAGADLTDHNRVTFGNPEIGDGAPSGRTTHRFDNFSNFNFNQLLNYTKSFGVHNVSVLVGHENYNRRQNFITVSRATQTLDGNIELSNFAVLTAGNGSLDRYRVEGYFSRINYDFSEKYFASVSFRRDGSSKFYKDERWGNFMAISGAWRLDQEGFIQALPFISQLKLRASYGQTGNDGSTATDGETQDISYYAWQPLYNLGWNNAAEPGILQGSLGNRNLTWESSDAADVALEFGLFNNRITGTVEYFNRASSNLIFSVPMPLSSGVTTITKNIGTMVNRGIELTLGAEVLKLGDFSWQLDVNATKLKNEITKMPDESKEIIDDTKKLKEGSSIYDFWLREYKGINPANGDVLYRADTWNPANSFVNEAGDTVTNIISNARYHYAGSSIPKIAGGFTNTFRYKDFSLSAVVVYQIGGKVYDGAYASLMSSGGFGSAKHVDILNRWQNPGDITNVPRMDDGRTTDYNGASDRWLTSASYLNLRSVTLSYNLPRKWANKAALSNAQFFISGENLLFNSKRVGMNVQQNYGGTTSNVYSPAKSFVLGTSITL